MQKPVIPTCGRAYCGLGTAGAGSRGARGRCRAHAFEEPAALSALATVLISSSACILREGEELHSMHERRDRVIGDGGAEEDKGFRSAPVKAVHEMRRLFLVDADLPFVDVGNHNAEAAGCEASAVRLDLVGDAPPLLWSVWCVAVRKAKGTGLRGLGWGMQGPQVRWSRCAAADAGRTRAVRV